MFAGNALRLLPPFKRLVMSRLRRRSRLSQICSDHRSDLSGTRLTNFVIPNVKYWLHDPDGDGIWRIRRSLRSPCLHSPRACHPGFLEGGTQMSGCRCQFGDSPGRAWLRRSRCPQHLDKRFGGAVENTFVGIGWNGMRFFASRCLDFGAGRWLLPWSFVLARPDRYHSWIRAGERELRSHGTEYLLARLDMCKSARWLSWGKCHPRYQPRPLQPQPIHPRFPTRRLREGQPTRPAPGLVGQPMQMLPRVDPADFCLDSWQDSYSLVF